MPTKLLKTDPAVAVGLTQATWLEQMKWYYLRPNVYIGRLFGQIFILQQEGDSYHLTSFSSGFVPIWRSEGHSKEYSLVKAVLAKGVEIAKKGNDDDS